MRPSDYHDDEIVIGCLRGESKYQKLLYEKYYSGMMPVCLRYTINREEARDVMHEAFMKVFKNLRKFEVGTNLGAWIRRIIVNTSIDHYRKLSKKPNLVEINHAVHEIDVHNVIADLSAEEILKLVQQLSPAYKTVFNLYIIDGYSHKEIGKMLGISEGTSKSNLAKARAKLKTMISKARIINKQRYA